MTRRIALTSTFLLLAAPAHAHAQQAKPVGAWRPVANPIAGWHALGPVLLSVSAVAGFGTGTLNVPEPGTTFVLAAIEPGIHAGRVSLAVAHWLRFEGGGILRATALFIGSRGKKSSGRCCARPL